jgi:glycosyltransferase involved in cell wall biosynthesis
MLILAAALADAGEDVDVVVINSRGPFREQVDESVRVVDLSSNRVVLCLPKLVRYLRRERPTVFLSSLNHANVMSVIARSISGAGTKVVVCLHSTMSQAESRTLKDRILHKLMRYTYPKADKIVAVSEGVAEDVALHIGLDRSKIEVVYNPVVTPAVRALAQQETEHPWFLPGSPPVVMGVGRLEKQKDFGTLIRAFAELRKRRKARLMILGEGNMRRELESLVGELGLIDDVALAGFVSNPFVLLRRAGAFVLSSRWEGLPTALIEAMACGTPVVATDCPSGPREILEGGKWGRLISVGDVPSLCAAIGETLDASERPDVEMRARDFEVGRAVQRYREVIFG